MKKTLFITAGILLLLVFVAGALYFNAEKADQAGQLIEQNQAGLVRDYSPQLGPTAAKVRSVEFLDPACSTCKRFYPFVKDILTTHPEQTHLTLRYAPFHTHSDQVVAMLYAADKQGMHWEVLEALLASQDDWVSNHVVQPERAWAQLAGMAGMGLDLAKLQSDMASPAITQQIAQDMADVHKLNISKTPEFLVNGKPMPSFGFDQLKALIDQELASEYR